MELASSSSAFWAWPLVSIGVMFVLVALAARSIQLDRDIPSFLVHSLILAGLAISLPGVPGVPDIVTSVAGAALAVALAVPLRLAVNHDAGEERIRIEDIWLVAAFGIWFGVFDIIPALLLTSLLMYFANRIYPPAPDSFLACRLLIPAAAVLFFFIMARGFWPAETVILPASAAFAALSHALQPLAWFALPFSLSLAAILLAVPVIQEMEAEHPSRLPIVIFAVSGLLLAFAGFPSRPDWSSALLAMSVAGLVAASIRGLLLNKFGDTNLEGGEVYLAAGAGAWLGLEGLLFFAIVLCVLLPATWAATRMMPSLRERTCNGALLLSPPIALSSVAAGLCLLFA